MSWVLARGVGAQSCIGSTHYLLQLSANPHLLPRTGTGNSSCHSRSVRHLCAQSSAASDKEPLPRPRPYKLISKDTAPEDWPTVEHVKQRITAVWPEVQPVHADSFPSFVRNRSPAWHYCHKSKQWRNQVDPNDSLTTQPPPLEPGAELQILTWNVDATGPAPSIRILAVIREIRRVFYSHPEGPPLIVNLQEVDYKCIGILRDLAWIRRNFYVSEAFIDPDTNLCGGKALSSSVVRAGWGYFRSFGITLISRRLPRPMITTVQFGSWTTLYTPRGIGLDVVLTDLPVLHSGILRVANTRLTPGRYDFAFAHLARWRQFRETSAMLQASSPSSPVVAAVLGVDLNINRRKEGDRTITSTQPVFKDASFAEPRQWIADDRTEYTEYMFPDRLLYRGHIDAIGEGSSGATSAVGHRLKMEIEVLQLTKSRPGIGPFYVSPGKAARLQAEHPDGVFGRGGWRGTDGGDPSIFYTLPVRKTKKSVKVSDHRGVTAKFRLGDYTRDLPTGISKK